VAKTLADFSKDIRLYLGKGKVRQARKALDKASKAGVGGIDELELEVRLAEENPAGAAEVLSTLAADPSLRLASSLKTADMHLRKSPQDIVFRDAVWEAALTRDEFDLATRQLSTLVDVAGFDAGARAQRLLGRKDAVGATGIFMLATLGGISTDRIKLADRLLGNEQGSALLSGVVGSLQKRGIDDGAINYVLAQAAKRRGDHDAFVAYAGKAFDEVPEELWTWTETNATPSELLEIAAHKGSLPHLLKAAKSAEPESIIAAAQKAKSDGATGGTLRALALLLQGKAPNACRVIETTIADEPAAVGPVSELLHEKRGEWPGACAVCATVLGAGDEVQIGRACDVLLQS
jgi:hypothetical protein